MDLDLDLRIILSVQTKQVHCSNGPPILRLASQLSQVKNLDFEVINQNSMVFFVASMEAKIQLDTSYSFRVFWHHLKHKK